jgi:hypothetical protein
MSEWIVFGIIIFVIAAIAYNRQQKVKSSFGFHLRQEFPEFADEITDEVAQKIIEALQPHSERYRALQKKEKKINNRIFKTKSYYAAVSALQDEINKVDHDSIIVIIQNCPPRFKKHLQIMPDDLRKERIKRACDALGSDFS